MDLNKLFIKSDLIPVIIQDCKTLEVLMLAYMNRESLSKTFETKETWFWSRSRGELWHKGATSGHIQRVIEIYSDCDNDTLLIKVEQVGAACHTGEYSCFFNKVL
jgi:phosphoribosyl-AMP cyclohydrolase/phosphoribosyl-ATP pyrophosphohydrolase/phosphoribosyl-AMP cyclohydrolase